MKGVVEMMKANEELQSKGIEECEECHYSSYNDGWSYVDFTSKTVVECPQCHTKIYLENFDAVSE
jgi:uncharacterized paraquat-inducible protein A